MRVRRLSSFAVLMAVIGAMAASLAEGADAAGQAAAPSVTKPGKKMGMDEPMHTGMMKPGMRKGEVKRAATKKTQALRPMMEQEEKSMPQDKATPTLPTPPTER